MAHFGGWAALANPIISIVLMTITVGLILLLRHKLVCLHQAHQDQLVEIKKQLQRLTHSGTVEEQEDDLVEQSNETKIYIGNVDYDTSETELEAHFNRFGEVEFVNIPVNRYNGRARGFGFVAFKSRAAAGRALTLDGSEFRGRQIQVSFAKERAET